ncbi:hypothetical protein M501DRAFT_943197, partial [Patellaria atrata CBS 101060]
VSGGFASLTFNNTIDADKPLCQFEAAGGSCNDPHCHNQHFREMVLEGHEVLVELGTIGSTHSLEKKKQWADALKVVLAELRLHGAKDTDPVASRIVAFRRKFFDDPTKVLDI